MLTTHHLDGCSQSTVSATVVLLTLCLVTPALFACPRVALSAASQSSSGPTTYLELYLQTYECGLYFTYLAQGLHQSGAPEEEVERYAEQASTVPWALVALLESMSDADQRRAVKQGGQLDRKFQKKAGRGYSRMDTVRAEYDARCIAVLDHFDETAAAIKRQLERKSGDPFSSLKRQCVKVSTDLLTVTGEYLGMVGPSVKEVRSAGLSPMSSPKPGDNLQINLPRGTIAEWEALPTAAPSDVHLKLLAATEARQAEALGQAVQERLAGVKTWGACRQPVEPYFRGLDRHGNAYWAITCLDGERWPVQIMDDGRSWVMTPCPQDGSGEDPDCYKPCRGQRCFTTKPTVASTLVYVPYSEGVEVIAAPAERCAEIKGFSYHPQGGPPAPNGTRSIQVFVIDPPKCGGPIGDVPLMVQIEGEEALDVLYVDIESIQVPGFSLDLSGGPPCELLHGNPTADQYADLRCRFAAQAPTGPTAPGRLDISGRFVGGARFEGSMEACLP